MRITRARRLWDTVRRIYILIIIHKDGLNKRIYRNRYKDGYIIKKPRTVKKGKKRPFGINAGKRREAEVKHSGKGSKT